LGQHRTTNTETQQQLSLSTLWRCQTTVTSDTRQRLSQLGARQTCLLYGFCSDPCFCSTLYRDVN